MEERFVDSVTGNPQLVVKGNRPLLLDELKKLWLIKSGSIAIFAVERNDGVLEGRRRYLFSLGVGEALFGMGANAQDKPYTMLAVAIEEATVCQLTTTDIELKGNSNGKTATLISQDIIKLTEKWIEGFSIFPGVVTPSTVLDTSAVYSWESLQSHLDQLYSNLYHYLAKLEQTESAQKLTQFQERERLNHQVTTEAIAELASVIKPQLKESFQQGTPLLIAAGAVGRAMGIQINPPAQSEDLNRVREPIEAIARASRIRIRRVILRDYWWKKDNGPLLAYTREDNRPVALLPMGVGQYEVLDPESGKRVPVNANNASFVAPMAYMFYRSFPDQAIKALDLLQFTFRGRSKELITLMLTGVAAAVLGMVTPQATAILIDNAIPDADRGLLGQVGLGLLAASFGSAIFQLAQGLATLRLQTISEATSQAAVWDRLLNLRISFFQQYSTGDLISRVSAISEIRNRLSGTVMQTLFTSFFSLLNLGLLFIYDAQLALVPLGVALTAMIVTTTSGILTRRKLRPLQKLAGEIFGLTVQLIVGVSKLRVAGAENRAFAYWAKYYTQQIKLVLSTQFIEDLLNVFNTILPTLSQMIIFAVAVQSITKSESGQGLSTGTFLAFNTAFGTFITGATDLSNTLINILEIGILWERTQPILEATPELDLSKADPGRLSGQIKLDHVSFRYRQDGPLILDNITIQANPGEFIALVGPSGSGKSTIIRLLLGFETSENGTIYYDGQDLSGLDISAVRRQLGVVLQNGRINSASMFDNIASGALVTMDEAWEAAKMAGFADDIEAMPMGMHTVISEGGTNLSGGQRQRLLIARALVLKPRLLIFDEATSALDNRTQSIVSQSIDELQVTRIVIAHRLSTIRKADRIYVLEAGRVVQQGTFEELVNEEGLFANLMARQMA
ncbi:NHLP bacteriocin export ABC transporter permease/ATPase subunit [Moorena bouillonii PNG]|uniref:NHLP bacteriocin export ABC transporter permease/ATPase subunit n=1 Tax=Moorena bouillonii PNG TaxID=568701 RepID=A0A1U7NAP7_9CYAN|nr:NHLP bacteriocin export ABC transporter permease/ATPase subunit [Moorena bouillonii PNG]